MSVTAGKKRLPNTKPVVEYALARAAGGRPTAYNPMCDEMATRFCLLGATDEELGRCLGVSEAAVKVWMNKHPTFMAAVRAGRAEADARVANSLYRRANGYEHSSEKIFLAKDGEVVRAEYTEHYPPDTASMIFWLKNRRRDLWRDTPPVLVQNNNTQLVSVGTDPVQIGQNYQQIMDADE